MKLFFLSVFLLLVPLPSFVSESRSIAVSVKHLHKFMMCFFCMCLFSSICKCAQLTERAHLCAVCQLSVCDSVVSLCLNPVVKELSGSKAQGLIILTKYTQADSHNRQRTICHLSVRHKTFCPKDRNNSEEYCGPAGCHWLATCVCVTVVKDKAGARPYI